MIGHRDVEVPAGSSRSWTSSSCNETVHSVVWNMLVDKYAKGSDVAMAEGRKIDPS